MEFFRKNIINKFFIELSSNHSYAILHHINNIYNKKNDIDFVVDCNKNEMINFLKKFCINNNCFIGNHYLIDIDIYRFDLIFFNENSLEKIELDCACNSKGSDILTINTKKLLESRIEIKFEDQIFFKISNTNEVLYYIKKKAFKKSPINEYYDYLKSLDKNNTNNDILEKFNSFKIYFKSKNFKLKFYKNKTLLFLNRIFNKQSLTISFLGSDGSGKSTIINSIEKKSFFINNYYFHLKPKNCKSSSEIHQVDDPHKHKPYSTLKSYLKLIFFIIQYNYGWLKNILKLKIKSSLIIFDRYYDDLLVDTKRYRYGGNLFIAKFIRNFIPRPDLYFILTTDAEIIYKRKQEVPFEELKRQIEEYRKLADGKRYFNINVNRTPEEISNEIIEIIARKMNERY